MATSEHSGLRYAVDATGTRLPVIDVTHPAFAVRLSDGDWKARLAEHRRIEERRARQPQWLQRLVFWILARRSYFGRRLLEGDGGFLDGMSTYRFKLGPDHIDAAWATPIDRKIAASLPALCIRLRLQDMAELLADDVAPRLAAAPGRPLELVNIAGGPCMDSLNLLLMLQQRDPGLLRGRRVHIGVFDQDDAGPLFAARALAALQEPGAALQGLNVTLTHTPYRWDNPAALQERLATLPRDIVAAASSEGGLFDYGSDEEIAANLEVLRRCLPSDCVVAGSLTPPKQQAGRRPVGPKFAIRERTLDAFTAVANRAGWRTTRAIDRPFQTTVKLTRA